MKLILLSILRLAISATSVHATACAVESTDGCMKWQSFAVHTPVWYFDLLKARWQCFLFSFCSLCVRVLLLVHYARVMGYIWQRGRLGDGQGQRLGLRHAQHIESHALLYLCAGPWFWTTELQTVWFKIRPERFVIDWLQCFYCDHNEKCTVNPPSLCTQPLALL